MYLAHFGLVQMPFHLTPDTRFFLGLAPHFEAIQTVGAALEMGEGVIKITGEVGTGKTMVCRMLLTHLAQDIVLLYLPNPALNGSELRRAVATELKLNVPDDHDLVERIQTELMALHFAGKRVIAMVDEAQALSDDALETLRLFGNLETENAKLLQIVLIGQPELDSRLAQHHLRQFRQRITFSAQLRPLTLEETVAYIDNRLHKSGSSGELFTLNQKRALWRACRGIPRLINQVCHKALLLTYFAQQPKVSNQQLYSAVHDTFDTCKPKFKTPQLWGWSH
ncbi:AAA family ATPase [Vibrio fluvialis]|uniref:ExeA family protein n=1 Tax=Vibrio fluvialis TaxID=676 RepID=UPI001C9D633A|nr:AAA family ATPase [Vibrio fluvialis]EKO3423215.1 ExeA family protein [Vibrio fluvialis]ELO1775431.1 ExeA family protein [Vibrio fluvialis]ELO1776863.1 ExeA family protein [Vibrio fluvialis]MBY8138678.1 AAA family ATPase [Vibrio fluvialis]MCR9299011.1 AAA family ATPase [Vibrio fluvialis]